MPAPLTDLLTDPLADAGLARSLDGGFTSRHADVDGVRLHYVEGGSGTPLVLLGGWPQTWWQWHKVMPALARRHRVIAVDLRGMGGSARPAGGYDKKSMARDVRGLVRHLGLGSVDVVGHDIGAMVAYAYAANHPEATRRICMLDVAHPDEGWAELRLLPAPGQPVNTPLGEGGSPLLWWFAFNQVLGLPEELLGGRSRVLVDWLAEHLTGDPGSIDERSREVYARAYSTADAVRAGNAWYREFTTDIADERTYAPVSAPVLVLGGELSNHASLREVMPAKGTDVRVLGVPDCGHYIPEERPEAVIDALESFLA
ncbi:alpha/beta hydrolase [Glycomyces fuscus]|nr:alpha/beta hydrolase [Glycomyces fuscus]